MIITRYREEGINKAEQKKNERRERKGGKWSIINSLKPNRKKGQKEI